MNQTRREFLCRALGATALAATAERLSILSSYAQGPGYKALVCIFLGGGNDANNMVVPLTDYPAYSKVRAASGLAIAEANLLPITPASMRADFGLHPSLSAIQPLFLSNRLAVVCNVGPLVQLLTKSQYLSGGRVPYQLFSHSDQIAQWQTSISTNVGQTGWGGRIADTIPPASNGFPVITSLAGGIYTRGQTTSPLTVAPAPTALNQVLVLSGFGTASDEVSRLNNMGLIRMFDTADTLIAAASKITHQALNISGDFNTDPVLTTVFPNTSLGNQLKQVAKIIKANLSSPSLGLSRQIFFCSLGGFDTHQTQVSTQASLLTQVGNAMKAFYDSTVELGVEPQVTTFTISDFSRTFQPSGSGAGIVGTDHAWGSHHFVMGGSVLGGDFYGIPGPSGTVFPTLQLSSADDTDTRGRWIPNVSVDQYGATLANWFGLSPSNIPLVFPNIASFGPSNLGFLM